MDFHEHRRKRRGEDLFGLIMVVISVGLFWQAYQIAGFSALSSPGAFPMAAAAMMVVGALTVAYGNLQEHRSARRRADPAGDGGALHRRS